MAVINNILSIVIIFDEKLTTANELEMCLGRIPTQFEVIIQKNIPTEKVNLSNESTLIKQTNNIKFYEYEYPVNDFCISEARNAAKKHATGEWILSLDTDEWIHLEDYNGIYDVLSSGQVPEKVGGVLMGVHGLRPGSVINGKLFDNIFYCAKVLRLFRNNPQFKWTGSLMQKKYCHEEIGYSITKAGYETMYLDLWIKHEGYDALNKPEQQEKVKRNIVWLCKDYANTPQDDLTLRQLINTIDYIQLKES